MKLKRRSWIAILFISVCILCGVFYLLSNFGKAIVNRFGLITLVASVILVIAAIRSEEDSSGVTKIIVTLIEIIQFPALYCWAWYDIRGLGYIGFSAHSVLLILGIVYLMSPQYRK